MNAVTRGAIVDLINPVVKGRGIVLEIDESRINPVVVRIGRRVVWARKNGVEVVLAASNPIARMHAQRL